MHHIAVLGFASPPCQGLVEEVVRLPAPAPLGGHRSLPIVNSDGAPLQGSGSVPQGPQLVWICRGCGKTWEREPLPDEVL